MNGDLRSLRDLAWRSDVLARSGVRRDTLRQLSRSKRSRRWRACALLLQPLLPRHPGPSIFIMRVKDESQGFFSHVFLSRVVGQLGSDVRAYCALCIALSHMRAGCALYPALTCASGSAQAPGL